MRKSFEEIAAIEPRLKDLGEDITQRMKELPNKSAVRDRVWYKVFKPRFIELVGFMAEKPELRTCEAYDTVYQKFIELIGA